MTQDRRRSEAAGYSWRKWEPSSWEVEWRDRQRHDRRVRRLEVAYAASAFLVILLIAARST